VRWQALVLESYFICIHQMSPPFVFIFTRESSYCFQRILAITILSDRHPSVTRVDQSKTVQARITKSFPSAAWKTLVSGTVKLFHKFEGGHPEQGH